MTSRTIWAWAPPAGMAIGLIEWLAGATSGRALSLLWIAAIYTLMSTAVALAARGISRLKRGPDPLWLWAWVWLGSYGVIAANVGILPRQSFLTAPSLALTAGTLVAAAIAARAASAALRGLTRRAGAPVWGRLGGALAACALVFVAAVAAEAPRVDLSAHHSPRRADQKSAVLIVIDTMRADHLSCYGYGRPTTPAIDALASRGTRFDSAWSPSSWTVPSVASLFSGLPLSVHRAGAVDTPFAVEPTLAGQLTGAGVVTAGFSANWLVSPLYGFDRGFDLFVSYRSGLVSPLLDLSAGTTLNRTVRRGMDGDRRAIDMAAQWLRAHREDRFFLYVHLFSPHRPYNPPAKFRARFVEPGYAGTEYEGAANGRTLPPPALRNVTQRYDAEIAYADSLVGELTDEISRLGLDDTTAILVTSDHGEAFGEHGYWEHGQALYAEETRIPLVARMPQPPPPPTPSTGRVIAGPVSLTDLYATVLDLLEVDRPDGSTPRALSLMAALREGEEPPVHAVVSEILGHAGTVHPETYEAVTLGDARLVRNVTRDRSELFDRLKDAGEMHPLANPDITRMLDAFLSPRWWEPQGTVATRKVRLDDEELRHLRSLGYVR